MREAYLEYIRTEWENGNVEVAQALMSEMREALDMTEESGVVEVNTSKDHRGFYKDQPTHKVGYFAYYNNDTFANGQFAKSHMVLIYYKTNDNILYVVFQ